MPRLSVKPVEIEKTPLPNLPMLVVINSYAGFNAMKRTPEDDA
jgi:hypothetical protein